MRLFLVLAAARNAARRHHAPDANAGRAAPFRGNLGEED
jgi:hypothetical protein